jgi:hypothetical protein
VVGFLSIPAGLVGVGLAIGRIARIAAGIAWRGSRRSVDVGRGVDGVSRLLPLRFLGVDVDVEPRTPP